MMVNGIVMMEVTKCIAVSNCVDNIGYEHFSRKLRGSHTNWKTRKMGEHFQSTKTVREL